MSNSWTTVSNRDGIEYSNIRIFEYIRISKRQNIRYSTIKKLSNIPSNIRIQASNIRIPLILGKKSNFELKKQIFYKFFKIEIIINSSKLQENQIFHSKFVELVIVFYQIYRKTINFQMKWTIFGDFLRKFYQFSIENNIILKTNLLRIFLLPFC